MENIVSIAVRELSADISVNEGDEGMEIDLLVVNTTEAVAIEVKSKLTKGDVDEHLERLDKFIKIITPLSKHSIIRGSSGNDSTMGSDSLCLSSGIICDYSVGRRFSDYKRKIL